LYGKFAGIPGSFAFSRSKGRGLALFEVQDKDTRRTGLPLRVSLSVSLSFLPGFACLVLYPRALVEICSLASLCNPPSARHAKQHDRIAILFRIRGIFCGEEIQKSPDSTSKLDRKLEKDQFPRLLHPLPRSVASARSDAILPKCCHAKNVVRETFYNKGCFISDGEEDNIRAVYPSRERWDWCDPCVGSGCSRRVFADGPCWSQG